MSNDLMIPDAASVPSYLRNPELARKANEEIAVFQLNAKTQVEKEVKAAGARARKNSLKLAALLKEWRKLSVSA